MFGGLSFEQRRNASNYATRVGAISSKELLGVMRAMGQNPTEDELNNLIMEVDLDGNGTIEFPEFLEMMKTKANEVDQGAELREAFRMFDRNKDGFIDRSELKRVANLLGTMLSKEEEEDICCLRKNVMSAGIVMSGYKENCHANFVWVDWRGKCLRRN